MVISAFVIASALLVVTTISGMLTVFNLRQIGNYINSMKAIYAADSGIEWWLYNQFNGLPPGGPGVGFDPEIPKFTNGARIESVGVVDGKLRVVGRSGRSYRSFEIEGF